MSPDVSITGDEIENNAILIDEQDGFLAVTHVPSGTRLLVDENTDLSDLWDAFDDEIDTSQFWQDDGSGIAELLSEYDGIRFPHGEAQSFSTDKATINNHPSDRHAELIASRKLTDVSSISETVEGISRDPEARYRIDIGFEDEEDDVNNELILTFDNLEDGEYNYTLEDLGLSATRRTSENEFVIFEPTDNDNADTFVGSWYLAHSQSEFAPYVGLWGRGVSTRRGGRSLAIAESDTATGVESDLTFEATASGDNLKFDLAIWEFNNWGDI